MSSNYLTPPNRRLVRTSRPHDFLYDPNYIMPSRQDFLKDAASGIRSGARINIKPVYESMFSELKSDRRFVPCLSSPKPNNLDAYMPQYDIGGVPVMPMDTGPLPLPREVDDVTGADRAKYAMRYGQPIYRMHHEAFDFNKLAPEEKKKILQTEKTRRSGFINRGVQTDLRESETQTDPFSPPYKLPHPGTFPKVLALIKLTWAKGLPFTLEDIVVIERALSRRALEHTSRVNEDDAAFDRRIKLMEELEAQQWADREKELDKILELKMEITGKLIHEYTGKIATEHTMRLERLQEKLKSKSSKHLEYVKHQYFRNLRKLERKYFEPKPTIKRNIIKEYSEFDSNVYAPLVRNGASMDLLNPAPAFQFDLHRDFESLDRLTESKVFIRKELAFDMNAFKERIKKCEPSLADQRLEKKLEKVFTAFKDNHGPRKFDQFERLEHEPKTEGANRLTTPVIELDDDTEEGIRRPHCITLQKIARGRVIQKLIRNEIEQNMNELLGMKLMFDMDPNCQRLEEGQMQKLIAMKKQSEAEAKRDTAVKEVLGHLEGETLNKMLDFLDKEMIRLIDERKIHALILLAERERRRKEAVEAGRRHSEEENRRAMDEIFRQVVGITQGAIDIYLEEAYIESSDRTADETSRNHVRQLASTLNEASYSMPTDIGDFEREELSAELVSTFLVPELSRLYHREKIDASKIKYKKAAGQVIDAVFSAHSVSKKIVEGDVPPIVLEHNTEGWAAADGSVSAVDDFIRQAVYEAMKGQEAAEKQLLDQEAQEREERQLEENLEESRPSIVEDIEIPEDLTVEFKLSESEIEKFELEYPEEQVEAAVEEEKEKLEESQLLVHDDVKASLAVKSLQLAMKTEPTQTVANIFAGAAEALEDIFTEARRQIVPDKEEEEFTDATLDEDTDED